jgi:hypothetical protein
MTRSWLLAACAGAIAFVIGSGCFMPNPVPSQTLTGTLHSVRPVGGGEPSGWVLNMGEGSGMMGNSGMGMNLDVSKVKKQAMELDGKQVTVVVRPGSSGNYEVESFAQLSPSKQ